MNWTDIIGPLLTFVTCWAWYVLGRRSGRKQERSRIIEHGCWFQRSQSEVSPTMNDFLNAIENGRHWE